MKRSLRRTLLGWHAVILLIVLGAFAAVLHARRRADALRGVDAELAGLSAAVQGAIEWDEQDGLEIEIRDDLRSRFAGRGADAPYFVIRDADGGELARSGRPPAAGARRELALAGPAGTHLLVGRGTADLEAEVARFGLGVFAAALGAFVLALAGGAFLVRRLLAPIERIGDTAARLSASNRGERIDLAGTESELGDLARVLNAAFDRLDEAVERQARFTADASHELRTPLAVLQANVEWARRPGRTAEERAEALEAAERAVARMRGLVEDLLELARADAGERALHPVPLDLADLAREVAAFLAPLAAQREVAVTVDGGSAPVEGDAERLRRAVTNLLANAIEHNRAGGRAWIATRVDGEDVVLAVADDGPGIPDADRSHVFERFYRADPARSGERGGRGLGLAIAKEAVEAHGGRIEAARGEAGPGTVFTLRLPRVRRGAYRPSL